MSNPWQVHTQPILESIEKLRRVQDRGDVTTDEVLYAAALRHLQALSEATQRLPEEIKDAHPNIPWRDISGFRSILVHNYLGEIDSGAVATALVRDRPPLAVAVRAMLVDQPTCNPGD